MAADAAAVERLDIVIIGGGVIGCSAAYYLTRHPTYEPGRHAITLLEATRLAAGASGKAGGLLARWAYPSCLVPLSFDLHAQLAAEHGGASAWGYRTIRCGKLTARDRRLDSPEPPSSSASWAQRIAAWVPLPKLRDLHEDHGGTPAVGAAVPNDLDWFRRDGVVAYEDIAPQSETAQVHPHQFTTALARLAEERGARILVGAAAEEIQYTLGGGSITSEKGGGEEIEGGQTGASGPRGKAVRSVRYVDKATGQSVSIRADVVILAAGPWTPDLFPAVPMRALRAHSITVKPTRKLSAYCLFTDISLPLPGMHRSGVEKPFLDDDDSSLEHRLHPSSAVYVVSPEIYSRPNNEVYVAGEGDSRVPLPPSTDEVEVDRTACDVIEEAAAGVSDELRGGLVTGRRACYLPTVDLPSGNPLIGPTWIGGLILATGHGCWGIHNAPATGKLVSEMVFDGEARSADSSGLDPRIVI